jgi:hypothetical protein
MLLCPLQSAGVTLESSHPQKQAQQLSLACPVCPLPLLQMSWLQHCTSVSAPTPPPHIPVQLDMQCSSFLSFKHAGINSFKTMVDCCATPGAADSSHVGRLT